MKEHLVNTLTNERAMRQAKERGCTIEYADDHTLQLDIDSEADLDYFDKQIERLEEHLDIVEWFTERESMSGNTHIIVHLKSPLPVEERIMLQACLGSDRTRELLNYFRHLSGEKKPILLFAPGPDSHKLKKHQPNYVGVAG